MTGVSPSDRADRAQAKAPGARRTGWFSRATAEVHCEDQEAEVREQLYAKPDVTARTVRRVERVEPRIEPRVERPERIEPRPERPEPRVERIEPRPERVAHIEPRPERIEPRPERAADRPAA